MSDRVKLAFIGHTNNPQNVCSHCKHGVPYHSDEESLLESLGLHPLSDFKWYCYSCNWQRAFDHLKDETRSFTNVENYSSKCIREFVLLLERYLKHDKEETPTIHTSHPNFPCKVCFPTKEAFYKQAENDLMLIKSLLNVDRIRTCEITIQSLTTKVEALTRNVAAFECRPLFGPDFMQVFFQEFCSQGSDNKNTDINNVDTTGGTTESATNDADTSSILALDCIKGEKYYKAILCFQQSVLNNKPPMMSSSKLL